MIKYLYVPIEENPVNYIKHAKDNGCIQIIHGRSEIINDYIDKQDDVIVVKIPQIRQLITEKNVFPLGDEIEFYYIDEWVKHDKYIYIDADILYIDMDDPNKINKIEEIRMSYDGEYCFNGKFVPEVYGEYIISIYASKDDNKKKKIVSKEIIVYKKEESQWNGTETFKFEL